MTNNRAFELLSIVVLVAGMSTTVVAQQEEAVAARGLKLKSPAVMTLHSGTGHAFIVEAGTDRLLRWDQEESDVLFDGLSTAPVFLEDIAGATFRAGNRVILVGTRSGDSAIRIATFRVGVDGPTKFIAGLSGDILVEGLGEADEVTAVASTDFATYVGLGSEAASRLYYVPTTKLHEAREIAQFGGRLTALGVNPQGHLLAAVKQNRKVILQFLHAETGQKLVSIPTDMAGISSLSYSPRSRHLYASGSTSMVHGVFRLESDLNQQRQVVRAVEVYAAKNVIDIETSQNSSIVLTATPEGAQAEVIDVDK